jgi:hypothetical protein
MPEEGIKREHRIDSSDSARPPATLESETTYYAQGLKPKIRVITGVSYQELDETVSRGKNKPVAKLILKTTTYDDGTAVDTTVGEDNILYQQHLQGIEREAAGDDTTTRRRTPVRKPTKGKAKE